MNFLCTFLSASTINKFESNNTKFHKGLYAGGRNDEIGAFKYVGVQDRALKLCPGGG